MNAACSRCGHARVVQRITLHRDKSVRGAEADPETSQRGGGHMKYRPPCSASIFFMIIFYRRGGGMARWIRY